MILTLGNVNEHVYDKTIKNIEYNKNTDQYIHYGGNEFSKRLLIILKETEHDIDWLYLICFQSRLTNTY